MKKNLFYLTTAIILCLALTSCTTSIYALRKNAQPAPTHKLVSISSNPSGATVYMDDKYIGVTPLQIEVPLKYQHLAYIPSFSAASLKKIAEKSATKFTFVKTGYETVEKVVKPTLAGSLNKMWNYNGQVLGLDYIFPEGVFAEMTVAPNMASIDTTIPMGESNIIVNRDAPGASALEKTIIRWYFDSEPRGARVFWRVVSSIPAQVKNTNESYLGTTPFEETRSFNIHGLTYENSRDVQIEVKVTRPGYMEQTKRFNVRQAIDQMEISSFYDLVPRD